MKVEVESRSRKIILNYYWKLANSLDLNIPKSQKQTRFAASLSSLKIKLMYSFLQKYKLRVEYLCELRIEILNAHIRV
jgi:hypothetical protein